MVASYSVDFFLFPDVCLCSELPRDEGGPGPLAATLALAPEEPVAPPAPALGGGADHPVAGSPVTWPGLPQGRGAAGAQGGLRGGRGRGGQERDGGMAGREDGEELPLRDTGRPRQGGAGKVRAGELTLTCKLVIDGLYYVIVPLARRQPSLWQCKMASSEGDGGHGGCSSSVATVAVLSSDPPKHFECEHFAHTVRPDVQHGEWGEGYISYAADLLRRLCRTVSVSEGSEGRRMETSYFHILKTSITRKVEFS